MNTNPKAPSTPLRRLPLLLALAAAALLVAGCVDGTGGGDSEADIIIRDMKYVPATYTIQAGETVTWYNEDNMQHTVTPTDKELWGTEGSGDDPSDWMNQGDTWSHTFTEPGEYEYICIPHAWEVDGEWSGQVGKIIVE